VETQKGAIELQKHTIEVQKQDLEREKFRLEMWKKATDVVFFTKEKEQLFGHEMSLESRRLYRNHWLETYNEFANIKLSKAFTSAVMEQDAASADTHIVKPGDNPAREAGEEGDGWVAVGRLPSKSYGDLNFEVPEEALASTDGTIKPGTVIHARWSVNLRKTHDSVDQGKGKNPVLGIMQAGECATVVRSKAKIRGHTWAYVDVVPCPMAMLNTKDARG
jgi:hypothetical protein